MCCIINDYTHLLCFGNSVSCFPEVFTVDIQKVLCDLKACFFLWPRGFYRNMTKYFIGVLSII